VAFINGKPYKSAMGFLSQRYGEVGLGFHSVVFNPSDHDLVRGDPAFRRAAIDRVVAAEKLEHLENIQRYQKVLDQRNALLRSENLIDLRVLDGFTSPLVDLGSKVIQARWQWFESAAETVQGVARTIAPGQQDVGVSYSSKWAPVEDKNISNFNKLTVRHFTGQCKTPSIELFKQAFIENLARFRALELRSRATLVGPHRDDWQFTLGGESLQAQGSQGEVRAALLAFKIAEASRFQMNSGHAPLFLLDDFSSELDEQRRNYLLGFLESSQFQVFVTTTDERVSAGKRFEVTEGACKEFKQ
jgi:DNA replication and repair protein RecF